MGDAVSVADKDILSVHRIGSAVSCSLIGLLVTFKEELTTALAHIDALRIEIRPLYCLTASYSYLIGALAALTAVVP